MVRFPVDFRNFDSHAFGDLGNKNFQFFQYRSSQTLLAKLSSKNHVVVQREDTVCLSAKVVVSQDFHPRLEELETLARRAVKRMLRDRSKASTKDYPELPSVLAKALVRKYQRNAKMRSIKNIVLPVCGDKGRQVKMAWKKAACKRGSDESC